MKQVAVEGDVKAEANDSAGFVATPVIEVKGTALFVNNKAVVRSATCTFVEGGTGTTDVVNLQPGSTLLNDGGQNLLLDGDSITSPLGNKLEVDVSQQVLYSG